MIVPENKDVFRNHLLVLFLDVELAGIFSSHLSGLKKKKFSLLGTLPHIMNNEALL